MKRIILFMLLCSFALSAEDKTIVHTVLCWLDSTVSETEIESIIEKTIALQEIGGIENITVGRAVPSERAIVDDSFTFGITMTFSSQNAMRNYLSDERHTSFVTNSIQPHLTKIVVYDIEVQQ